MDLSGEIVEFYHQNNLSVTANTTLLSEDTYSSFTKVGAHFILHRSEISQELLGGVILLPLTISVESNVTTGGVITYLCVAQSHRKQGVARQLIKRLQEKSVNAGVKIAYSTGISADFSTTASSIKIRCWSRPLRFRTAVELGFDFLSYRQPADRSDYRTSMAYNCNLPANLKVTRVTPANSLSALSIYQKFNSLYRVRYNPSPEEWMKWHETYPTHLVTDIGTEVVGLFMVNPFNSLMNNRKIGKFILLLLAVGHLPSVLKAVIHVSHNMGSSVLYGYEVGGITEEMLTEIKAVRTKTPIHLSFHSQGASGSLEVPTDIETSKILLPLL